ncbi:hypothetical protein FQN50_008828 [Emmonsiellopsis sp. PD_5]|nr:hypothetical protein FQN50_008828 [Emmonsiellopsis sp. PD_5]
MASLNSMPAELLELIISNVECTYDRLSLLRVCQRLYQALRPTIYKSVRILPAHPKALKSLVLTFLENPTLAQETRELDLSTLSAKFWGDELRRERDKLYGKDWGFSEDDRRVFGANNHFHSQIWMDRLQEGNPEAFLALLVVSLPNLEKLSFVLPYSFEENRELIQPRGYLETALVQAAAKVPPFDASPRLTRLSSLAIVTHPVLKGVSVDHCSPWLLLTFPSLRHLSIDNWCYGDATTIRPVPCSNITHIRIHNGATEDGLYYLLSACPNLISFNYTDGPNFSLTGMLWLRSKRTPLPLEALRLDFTKSWLKPSDSYTICGLADLRILRFLHIDEYTLLERTERNPDDPKLVSMLPSSLESLHVVSIRPQEKQTFFDQLRTLASMAKDRFPSLHRIALTGKGDVECEIPQGVLIACQDAGISCISTVDCHCFEGYSGGIEFDRLYV